MSYFMSSVFWHNVVSQIDAVVSENYVTSSSERSNWGIIVLRNVDVRLQHYEMSNAKIVQPQQHPP